MPMSYIDPELILSNYSPSVSDMTKEKVPVGFAMFSFLQGLAHH